MGEPVCELRRDIRLAPYFVEEHNHLLRFRLDRGLRAKKQHGYWPEIVASLEDWRGRSAEFSGVMVQRRAARA